MKAQRIILLTLAIVGIPALAIACATKAQIILQARLQPSARGSAVADASQPEAAAGFQFATRARSQENPAAEATPVTNLVDSGSPSVDDARSNPEPDGDAANAPVPAVTLGTRVTSGEGSVVFWIGIFIVACVLFPAVAPLAGRMLAAVVNRTPSLAGLAGVVSVEAFDALIKAIERSKQKIHIENDNGGRPYSGSRVAGSLLESWMNEIDLNLERELDAAHQRLVEARKQTWRTKGASDSR
jgi:hypothetical protein